MLSRPVRSLRPPLAPSSRGQALSPRLASHLPELSITRRHQGFTHVHPPGLPPGLLVPGWNRDPLGSFPGLRTPAGRTCRRTPGGGRASSTRPELYARHNRTSFPQAHSQCATSCRTIGLDMSRFPTAGHLVSWAEAVTLGTIQSGARSRGGRTGKGNPYLKRHPRRGRRRGRQDQTPSSASATGGWSSASASSRPWSPSPAPSW